MKRYIALFLLLFIVFNVYGCATAAKRSSANKSANGFTSQIAKIFSLSDADKDVSVIVGFKTLEDKRPKQDISYLTSIKEKLSDEILKTIRGIQLFDEIHFPALQSDKIIISGEIRKFNVASNDTMIAYIPGLNVLPFLGLPSTRVNSEVEIYIEFRNAKANAVILGFVESYKTEKKFNIYNFQPEKADAELASCFGIVLNRIKEKINFNKNNILEVVKLGNVEAAKPLEIKEPPIKELPIQPAQTQTPTAVKTSETPVAAGSPVTIAEPPPVTTKTAMVETPTPAESINMTEIAPAPSPAATTPAVEENATNP